MPGTAGRRGGKGWGRRKKGTDHPAGGEGPLERGGKDFMASWENHLNQNRERQLGELLEFLRIPSISALPAHAADVQRAAEWVEKWMKAAGIESVRILPTGGHPVVYGDWLHAPGKPTVLIYGHFDTQPVDPLNLWDSPPFEPVIKGNRVYARGASDNKGNLFIPLTVVEALLRTSGRLPLNARPRQPHRPSRCHWRRTLP